MFSWSKLYYLDGFVSSPEKTKKRKTSKPKKGGKKKVKGKLPSQSVFDLDEVVVISEGKSKPPPGSNKSISNCFGK